MMTGLFTFLCRTLRNECTACSRTLWVLSSAWSMPEVRRRSVRLPVTLCVFEAEHPMSHCAVQSWPHHCQA